MLADPEVLIRVEGAGKKFCRDLKKSLWYGLKDVASELIPEKRNIEKHSILRPKEFWSVNDISFELRRGECLGLIGDNGAGKTTLLKMLNGLVKPDKGRIALRGRVGALIALGAGFNPILTGRENIYVNGSVLGLSKREIDAKMSEIIDFAGIRESIDAPVQNYSSGMQVRLGFAVATALEPDILLLDEVLAVGDAAFRNKCYNRIGTLRKRSCIIFVSHSMDQVGQFCNRVLLLSHGETVFDGGVEEGICMYEESQRTGRNDDDATFENVALPVTDVRITLDQVKVSHGSNIRFNIQVDSNMPVLKTILRIVLYDQKQYPCAEWNSARQGHSMSLRLGANSFHLDLGPILLKTGRYQLGVVLYEESSATMLVWSFKKHEIIVNGFTAQGPPVALRSELLQYPDAEILRT